MTTSSAPKGMRARRRVLVPAIVFIAASIIAIVAPATITQAAPPTQSCWENVDTGESQCFDSSLDPFTQIAEATGRPVVAVPTQSGSASASSSDEAVRPASIQATSILVVIYDATGFGGSSYSYFTTNSPVCAGATYPIPNIASGWNDRVKSFQSYNNCQTEFYQNSNFGGSTYGPLISSTNMGSFNSIASSLFVN